MRGLNMLLLAVASASVLMTLIQPAAADPVSLTIAGVNALFATSLTASSALLTVGATTLLTVGQAVGAALAVGASLAAAALTGKPKVGALDPGAAKGTFQDAETSEIRAIGRVRVGGLKVFGNTKGVDRYRLIAHCKGPIPASHIEAHFLGGREVTVEADGAVSSPPYARPGGSYIYIKSKPGDGTETAWPELTTAFPTLWTENHRLRGVAQTLIQYISPGLTSAKFQKMYQSGPPDYERIQRSELMFDPRTGLYAWSDNGILGCLNIALTFDEWTLDDFDLQDLSVEANRADSLVSTRTGTEKRSRLWNLRFSETERATVLADALQSAGARIYLGPNGKHRIALVDDSPEMEWTFTSASMINLKWRAGPESVERPNICKVKYYSPENNYELTEINLDSCAWARVQSEIDTAGKQARTYTLNFCPSASQAQRIARRRFAEDRAAGGVITSTWRDLGAYGCRYGSIELPDVGATTKATLLPMKINDAEGRCEIPFSEVPTLDPWLPSRDEAPAPQPIPDLAQQSNVATPAAASAAVAVTYPDASSETRFAYAAPPTGVTIVEFVYRIYTAGTPGAWLSATEIATPTAALAWVAGSLSGQLVDTRLRHFNAEEDGSVWSPVQQFTVGTDATAPGVPTITAVPDFDANTVELTITAPSDLNVANIELSSRIDPAPMTFYERVAIRPGEVITRTRTLPSQTPASQNVDFSAQAFAATSTGGGPTATVRVIVDGTV